MQSLQRTWGILAGLLTGLSMTTFVATAHLSTRSRGRVWTGVGILSLSAGLLLAYWVSSFAGWPKLTSLEGAWIYPCTSGLIALGTLALIRGRRPPRTKDVQELKW